MDICIDYPTHRIVLCQKCGTPFTKITIDVQDKVYRDMVDSIMFDPDKIHFVYHERQLLSGFLKSLISFHNNKYQHCHNVEKFSAFNRELDYYHFCVFNDLEFAEQEWCMVTYIKVDLNIAITLIKNASVLLIRTLYPESIDKSKDILIPFDLPETTPKPNKTDTTPIEIKKTPSININYKTYQSFLSSNNINCLYHFTSRDNLESIKTYGICSAQYLISNQISVKYASSDSSRSIDRHKNLDNYVHLSYERKNPMLFIALSEGRLCNYAIIEVSTDVIFLQGTKFTNCNAAKNGAIISDDIDFITKIPFKEFHNKQYNKSSPYKDFFMSEVLVKEKVSSNFILNVD